MVDQPGVEGVDGDPQYRVMDVRVSRLEEDARDVRAILARLEPMIVRIDATMPFLARISDVADLRTELKSDIADVRSELAGVRDEARIEASSLRAEMLAVRTASRTDLLEFRADVAEQFGRVHVELARKASSAGVWTVGITLLSLTVGGMAAGAIYLPLLFRVLHLAAP